MLRRMQRRLGAFGALFVIAAVAAACGGSHASSTSASGAATAPAGTNVSGGPLVVLAASSLKDVFPKLAEAFSKQNGGAKVEFSFAGSDELATQIEEGALADVYA